MGLSDAWFDSSHDLLVTVQGYSLYGRSRIGRRGGGVCIYVKSELLVNMKDNITCGVREDIESLWLELQGDKTNRKLIVGVCYRSPNLKGEKETDLLSQVEKMLKQDNVIIMRTSIIQILTGQMELAHHFLNVLQDNFMSVGGCPN